MVPQDEHHLPRRCAAVGPCDFSCSEFGHGSNNMGDTRYVTRARWKEGEGGVRLFSCHGDDDRDISDTAAKAMGGAGWSPANTAAHSDTTHRTSPSRSLSSCVSFGSACNHHVAVSRTTTHSPLLPHSKGNIRHHNCDHRRSPHEKRATIHGRCHEKMETHETPRG